MKTVMKATLFALTAAVVFSLATPTQAYFYQSQYQAPQRYAPQPTYSYQPYRFMNYSGYDEVSMLTQSNLSFVARYQYIPAPVHQYFYQYYTPSYYGYGW